MAETVYLVEMTAKASPQFLRSGAPGVYGSWYIGRTRVPVSSASTYRQRAVARRSAAADGRFYAGLVVYDTAGVALGGGVWVWGWVAANSVIPGTGWTTYTVDFGAATGITLPAGAAFMAPVILLNHASTVGTMDIMEVSVALASAPSVYLTADPYFRSSDEWTLYPATAVGSFLTSTAGTDTLPQSITLRYATRAYTTAAADTPPRTPYPARVRHPGLLRMELPADMYGPVQMGFGQVELINADGALAELANYGLDGQQLRLLRGDVDAPYSAFSVVSVATMEQALVARDVVRIRLRAPDARLNRPHLSNFYLGNNVLPAGLEGGDELTGRPKPRLYGFVYAIQPPLVNSVRNIYQVHDFVGGQVDADPANVVAVRDRGLALTRGTDYTSQADMETNAPATGEYRVWQAGGYFRLANPAVGTLLCDAERYDYGVTPSTGYVRWWPLVHEAASDAGVTEFANAASFIPPMPDNLEHPSWVVAAAGGVGYPGCWVSGGETTSEVLAQLCSADGAWFGYSYWAGMPGTDLEFGGEVFPPSSASLTAGAVPQFNTSNIVDITPIAPQGPGRGVPVWKVEIGYDRNHTPMSADFDPTLEPFQRADLGREYRWWTKSRPEVLNKHSMAGVLRRQTQSTQGIGAPYEARRLLELLCFQRQWFDIRVPLEALLRMSIKPRLGGYAHLTMPGLQFLLRSGVTQDWAFFTIHAIEIDFAKADARLTLRQATEAGELASLFVTP